MYDNVVRKIIEILKEYKIEFYLVGGAVRDLIIGIDPIDYDFVAQVDRKKHLEISRNISKKLNCEFIYNKHYCTSKFIIDGEDIDFVMARQETYDGIASTPLVKEGTLYEDLKRRDFTINTIAYDILNDKFIDYFNGINDIKNKKIVVLHSKSFRDDPTRFFRGIKYASRLNFNFCNYTYDLMRECVENKYFDYLPISRIRREIDDLLKIDDYKVVITLFIYFDFFNEYFNSSIDINIPIGNFKLLESEEKYICLFFKNNEETLEIIKNRLSLSKNFIQKCLKLRELNGILKYDDYDIYRYLVLNKKQFNSALLLNCFRDKRIENFIKNINYKIDNDKILNVNPRDRSDYIVNATVQHLIDLGGKNV
ncbi:CCA tRNA nucleotidyltransferase [Caloramator proteoclasticus]|uniref:Poly(A) polymerase n=1 Tax=Caloramator proteoclasticus DSM 10124 TaxID=1121262 RepID=A0A1M4TAB1_9CLOT|nr:CCA tRNA nucleotidyltransferase [Caloramator proteoclasticus]SHE41436.1 poly(A) polymerase [Caloramator proteoclasticus DSM 10124]